MLWTLIIVLVAIWIIGIVLSFTLNGLIHLILLVALGIFIYNIVTDREPIR